MPDNDFKQGLGPLDQLTQQAQQLQNKTTELFDGLTSELVGAGNAVMNAAGQVTSAVTGFISGAENAFSNFISRIVPKELLTKRSGVAGFMPAMSKIAIGKAAATSPNNLMFPLKPSNAKYKFRLAFREYERPSALSPPKINPKGSIVLPIPSDLLDKHNISYDVENSGVFGALWNSFVKEGGSDAQLGIRNGINTGDFSAVTKTIGKNYDAAKAKFENGADRETVAAIGKAATMYFAKETLKKEIYDLGTQVIGEIPNPHPTVVFRGVNLRDYQFTFNLYPTSAQETQMLRKIINLLKQYSLPSYVNKSEKNLLKYPMMCLPEFIVPGQGARTENGKDGALAIAIPFGFKYCVIKNITIQYAPSGQPAFFAGGKGETTGARITLDLQEIEVQTSEDYGGASAGDGDPVGGLIDTLTGQSGGAGSIISEILPDITPAGTNVLSSVANIGNFSDQYSGRSTPEQIEASNQAKIWDAYHQA